MDTGDTRDTVASVPQPHTETRYSAGRRPSMGNWDDEIQRHTTELVNLTMKAADQGPIPLPEDELATLGKMISTERQLLIDSISGLLDEEEPEAGASPGVAAFDAGFVYGLAFARALDDARVGLDRVRRGRILRIVNRND